MRGFLWKIDTNARPGMDELANRTGFFDLTSTRDERFRGAARGSVLDDQSLNRGDWANLERGCGSELIVQRARDRVARIFNQKLLECGVFGVESTSTHLRIQGAYSEDQEVRTKVHHLPSGFHAHGGPQMRFNLASDHDQSDILACREGSPNRRVLRRHCDFKLFGNHA